MEAAIKALTTNQVYRHWLFQISFLVLDKRKAVEYAFLEAFLDEFVWSAVCDSKLFLTGILRTPGSTSLIQLHRTFLPSHQRQHERKVRTIPWLKKTLTRHFLLALKSAQPSQLRWFDERHGPILRRKSWSWAELLSINAQGPWFKRLQHQTLCCAVTGKVSGREHDIGTTWPDLERPQWVSFR